MNPYSRSVHAIIALFASASLVRPVVASTAVSAARSMPTPTILREVAGPMNANAYLLYDPATKEAAIFDAGGAVDTLAQVIDTQQLHLKYIFSTHGHVDHVQGVAALRARYPAAKWCIAQAEFQSMPHYARWAEVMTSAEAAKIRAAMAENPALAETMSFDFGRLGTPDVLVEDGQTFALGALEIRALLSPGHSAGSMCYWAGDALFSGDVLFHRRVGRSDLPQAGGPAVLAQSVRRLYALLPGSTTVYPGHREATDIESEKTQNTQVRAEPIQAN